MKTIKSVSIFNAADIDIPRMLDSNIVTVECMYCGNRIRFPEAYVSEMQQYAIDDVIMKLNSFMEGANKAIIAIYGEDVRKEYLTKEIERIKKEALKPSLKVVR